MLHVRPIEGEWFRFFVSSATEPGKEYLVDLEESDFIGQCDCPDFRIRRTVNIAAGAPRSECQCKHIDVAKEVWYYAHARRLAEVLNRPPRK